MEATPKVHRHRHRRSDSRHQHRQHDSTRQLNNTTAATNNVVVANTTMVQRNHNNDIENSTPLAREQGALNLVASEEAAAAAIAAVAAAVASQSGGGGSRGNREGAGRDSIISAEEGCAVSVSSALIASATAETTSFAHQNERQNSSDSMDTTLATTTTTTTSQLSQQTVLLVNGQAPPQDSANYDETDGAATLALALDVTEETTTTTSTTAAATLCKTTNDDDDDDNNDVDDVTRVVPAIAPHLESPTQQNAPSSRNSSGDALSLRETLQQLPPTVGTHHHRHRRTHSPQSPSSSRRAQQETTADASFHRGILGFMDRELKHSSPTPSALSVGSGSAGAASGSGGIGGVSGVSGVSGSGTTRKLQSLSDPQASPAQRSIRSRSSLEKSPRRKRSKSESRRRRERKLIAAGEMEVRQANETLMRYLKQCSEMNDASLSGELEIDQNYDERRVHRKTKSQRDKRGHLISKLYTAGGLSSILKELSDDIVPADGEEIYNPFTPVVSPTEEDTPAHIDKMFLQTSSGYRPVERCYYKHSFVGASGRRVGGHHAGIAGGVGEVERGGGAASTSNVGFMRTSGSYGDTRCLLDAECGSFEITTNIQLACVIQRIWLLISNICHGLLAGLALAHLLFVLSSHPVDWSRIINHISLAGETTLQRANEAADISSIDSSSASLMDSTKLAAPTVSAAQQQSTTVIEDYATFAEIYLNTFYCLAIVCLVSIFDRMDICRWDLSNATELISFRWLIIAMIYIATIILTICSDSIDQRLYYNNNANITITQDEWFSNSVMSVWSSLAVTRSIGAICGWIMIGLTPHEDLLYEYLVDLTKYQLTNN